MKKFICILLVLICIFSLAACNVSTAPIDESNNKLEGNEGNVNVTDPNATIPTTEATEVPNATESTSPTDSTTPNVDENQSIKDKVDTLKQELENILKTDKFVLYATVVEIKAGSLLVEPLSKTDDSDFNVTLDADRVSIQTTDVLLPINLKVGDTVRITYDGEMLTSYPAKIVTVYEIIKYKHVEEDDKDEIEFLKSLVDLESHIVRTSWTEIQKNVGIESQNSKYPMFKFETNQEFSAFKNNFSDLKFDQLNAIIESKQDVFAENVVLLTYVTSGSGSTRYSVKDITVGKNALSVLLTSESPEIGTCDMAGWFVVIIVPKTIIENCTSYSTIVQNLNTNDVDVDF